jgi:hypothetical protein
MPENIDSRHSNSQLMVALAGPPGASGRREQGLVGTLGVSGRKGVLPPESAAPGAPSSVPTARSTARLAASSLEHAPGAAMRP